MIFNLPQRRDGRKPFMVFRGTQITPTADKYPGFNAKEAT
jgi:hypothetical protein